MSAWLSAIGWLEIDTWIVVTGALCAVSCALVGTFLVLRRMSLMGDAISHAVLPGLAMAFWLTGSRGSVAMLIGAGVVGLLTAFFTQWIHRAGKVDEGASMGVVFTVLFALGLVLIRQFAHHVDLDPGCVLYGLLEHTPLDRVELLGWSVPRAALQVGGVCLFNLLLIVLLYKEFRIATFDPALATTLGIHAGFMHYLLMALVAITTVTAFESVGSILVIAMLIVPAATARLLTDRLGLTLALAALTGALSALLGHVGAVFGPGWLGMAGVGTSTSGMIAVASGALFAGALVAAPRYGLVSRAWRRLALSLHILREDLLGLLYRAEEAGLPAPGGQLRRVAGRGVVASLLARMAERDLLRRGLIRRAAEGWLLTPQGRLAAQRVVRTHRLWETYFDQHAAIPASHLHGPAEVLEHVTGAELRERLAESVAPAERDPHGSRIPPGE